MKTIKGRKKPDAIVAATMMHDYLRHKSRDGNLKESFLETALYLEDTLGIVLSDHELTPEYLGDEEAIQRLATRKISGNS